MEVRSFSALLLAGGLPHLSQGATFSQRSFVTSHFGTSLPEKQAPAGNHPVGVSLSKARRAFSRFTASMTVVWSRFMALPIAG
jgi:hypothetical protein